MTVPAREGLDPLAAAVLGPLPDAVLLVDDEGAIRFANPSAHRLFGRDDLSLVGQPLGWPLTAEAVPELELVHPDGTAHTVELRIVPTAWQGRPARLVVLHDVTTQRRLAREREALRAAQSAILDALPSRVALLDGGGRIRAVNEAWRRHAEAHRLGLADAGVGTDYLAICAGADDPEARRAHAGIRDVLAGRTEAFSLEYECAPPGTDGWSLLSVAPIAGPEGLGAVVMHTDVTEAHLASELLRRSEKLLRAVVEGAQDAIVLADDAGRLVMANPAAEALFGEPPDRLLGRSLGDLAAPATAAPAEVWSRFLRDGEASGECVIRRPDGAVRRAEFRARAHVLPGRHLSVLRDATARIQLEEQLRHLQKMESIGQLTAGVAHDFNNLLTVILASASQVEGILPDDGRGRAELAELSRAATRGARMVRKLLAFSRREVLHVVAVDLGALVREETVLLRRLLPSGIELEVEVEGGPCVGRADVVAAEQALLNLAMNARDAMPRGGRIVITVRAAEVGAAAAVTRELPAPGRYVEVAVTDSGTGMPPEVLARVFEPFFTTKRAGQGTGLGLSMVYGLMQQQGGGCAIESEPGRGTTARLWFAAAEAGAATDEMRPAEPRATGGGVVLVVEDDPSVRRSAARILGSAGYSVIEAADGEEALERLTGDVPPPDIVLTDLYMPRLGGRELADRARRLGFRGRLILTSGYPRAELADGPELPDDVEFLHKPWTAQELLAVLGPTAT